jgi:hypothetical protein
MDLIISPNSVPLSGADAIPASGTPQYATNGNPLAVPPVLPTLFPAYHYNTLIEELLAIITAAGITPSRYVSNQILAAMRALFAAINGSATQSFAAASLITDSIVSAAAGSPIFLQSDDYTASVNHANSAYQQHYVAPATSSQAAVNLGQFLSTLGVSGDIELPGGFIAQWSYVGVTSSGGVYGTAVTIPLAFPNAHLWSICGWGGSGPPSAGTVASEPYGNSQIFITTNSPAAIGNAVYYLCIGK